MTPSRKFRKRPVVIDAWQWKPKDVTDINPTDWPKWLRDAKPLFSLGLQLVVPTLEGPMTANPGDWIIRSIEGEVYPCKASVFEATYDPVD